MHSPTHLPHFSSPLLILPPLNSHSQSSALIGPCSRGCHSPANRLSGACSLSNPKEGVSQRATPWLLLANSGHLLRPPASEGKGQTRAARHSRGGGWEEGETGGWGGEGRGRVSEVEGWGWPCWIGINKIYWYWIFLIYRNMWNYILLVSSSWNNVTHKGTIFKQVCSDALRPHLQDLIRQNNMYKKDRWFTGKKMMLAERTRHVALWFTIRDLYLCCLKTFFLFVHSLTG